MLAAWLVSWSARSDVGDVLVDLTCLCAVAGIMECVLVEDSACSPANVCCFSGRWLQYCGVDQPHHLANSGGKQEGIRGANCTSQVGGLVVEMSADRDTADRASVVPQCRVGEEDLHRTWRGNSRCQLA